MKEIIRIHQPSLLSIKVNQNNFNKWEENYGKGKFNL